MSIAVNEGGTRSELDTITVNEGGTRYELDSVQSNEGGTRYEILSAVEVPSSLTWTTENENAVISMGADGLSGYINNGSHGVGVLSNVFEAPDGCVLTIDVESVKANNTSATSAGGSVIVYSGATEDNVETEVCSVTTDQAAADGGATDFESLTVTLERGCFYRIVVTGGGGWGSTSGSYACSVTVKFSITFE